MLRCHLCCFCINAHAGKQTNRQTSGYLWLYMLFRHIYILYVCMCLFKENLVCIQVHVWWAHQLLHVQTRLSKSFEKPMIHLQTISFLENRPITLHDLALFDGHCNCSFKLESTIRKGSEREGELPQDDQSRLITYERPPPLRNVLWSVFLFVIQSESRNRESECHHDPPIKTTCSVTCICSWVTVCLKTAPPLRTYSATTTHIYNLYFGSSSLSFKVQTLGCHTLWICHANPLREICMLHVFIPGSHTHMHTHIHKHTRTHRHTDRWKPSTVLVDILTKKCLQMNGIDLFSLFSGPEEHWRLFEWKSGPFNWSACLSPPWPPWLLLACYTYWCLKHMLWFLPRLETLHHLKLLIGCVLVNGVIWETEKRVQQTLSNPFTKQQLN